MGYFSRYDRGDWKAVCDSCGREFKASQLRKRWDSLMVCEDDWEPRQPQDFVRGVADNQAPPWTRPEPSDTFIPFNFTSFLSKLVSITTTLAIYRWPMKMANLIINKTPIVTLTRVINYSKAINRNPINKRTLG